MQTMISHLRALRTPARAPDPELVLESEAGSLDPDAQALDDLAESSRDTEVPQAEDGARCRPVGCLLAVEEAQVARWIEQIADKDERALTALYDATLSRVYGLVLHIVQRPAWAEEVVEDTYFQVWRQALRFDAGRGRALPWLLGMARSRAIDALRREARFKHNSLDEERTPEIEDSSLPAAEDILDNARSQTLLHRALLELGVESRQLVALAFFRGLTHEEIAEQTALPLGTVKTQIRRSLIALRELLGSARLHSSPN